MPSDDSVHDQGVRMMTRNGGHYPGMPFYNVPEATALEISLLWFNPLWTTGLDIPQPESRTVIIHLWLLGVTRELAFKLHRGIGRACSQLCPRTLGEEDICSHAQFKHRLVGYRDTPLAGQGCQSSTRRIGITYA
ncbi:hypothetical protein HRR83_002551 [Exophiala dermatitidis]|uniref:Uncharacterized protein n=1 Tax=Exophiala dermatitidis TaxID=5970 RepID=A0AAN6IVR7_EXODE|nr:hypothetical protein HRR73_005492 [Exophiala dermatitidis]KAJ4523769.1 hypothetical protein HRR74_001962 [Exophiala dermatitidis]KAJ4537294.1 hypothetical protein HRR76_005305 [Exophiala dermatitidis]KAJ4578706.1 hypothetical protein HRR81_002854 [Exophiala dermatitidis]KAJ4601353.1 hypothetical protein HRR83_002551 [Exophiala dermatitidis]